MSQEKGNLLLAGIPMTQEQQKAIMLINTLCTQKELQFRAKLKTGEQVVFATNCCYTARTEFLDRIPSNDQDDPNQLDDLKTARRLMDRAWSNTRN